MRDLRGTQVVAEDLKRLYIEINTSRRYPFKFRQAFEQYIYKSQQLTETMRKEFKSLTGKEWAAKDFRGWNPCTEILKALRNSTYHGYPLALHCCAISVYEGIEFETDSKPLSEITLIRGYRIMKSTLFAELPFDEEVCPMSAGYPIKHARPGCSTHAFPLKDFVSYELTWGLLDEGVRKATDKAGTTDAVKITLHSYSALSAYIKYYEHVLDQHRAHS
ncbi:hypothetical protein [Pseudomonas sp. UBA6310]|uniref:hypothetical protein n=1 Tax=Pseudomonas sp. UBA6310 TaxID=1947327 RepID=UPI00257A5A55|nr:hypothetical protein [Pseudomonas sp. UBA6310]